MGREDTGPEVQGVRVLPVVDGFVRVFGGLGDASAEVDSKLPYIGEAGRIANVRVEAPQFRGRILHQVDASKCMGVGIAAAFDNSLIGGLEHSFAEGGVADDGKSADEKNSSNANCFRA